MKKALKTAARGTVFPYAGAQPALTMRADVAAAGDLLVYAHIPVKAAADAFDGHELPPPSEASEAKKARRMRLRYFLRTRARFACRAK